MKQSVTRDCPKGHYWIFIPPL
ncbi:hypothetical protein E1757_29260 [Paenibacillus piri]|uniref:Uncharacterized protein n=1 Tax=Paenibacillus piri TaxID=2547395 RepID=A0A4R5KCC3_9BACL|nr:hypothetical protein E1757_29260 [Paenibacillus piri]